MSTTAHIEDAKAQKATVTAHMVSVTAHMNALKIHAHDATSYTATVIAHTAPGTIKHPFEPTATVHEEIAKIFFKGGFTPLDPHILLKLVLKTRKTLLENRTC